MVELADLLCPIYSLHIRSVTALSWYFSFPVLISMERCSSQVQKHAYSRLSSHCLLSRHTKKRHSISTYALQELNTDSMSLKASMMTKALFPFIISIYIMRTRTLLNEKTLSSTPLNTRTKKYTNTSTKKIIHLLLKLLLVPLIINA